MRFLQLRSTFQPVPQTTKPTLAFLKQMLQLYKQLVSQTLPLFQHFLKQFYFFQNFQHINFGNTFTLQTLSLFKHLHLPNTFTFQTLLLFNHFYFPTTFTSKTLSLFKHLHFPNTFSFQTLLLLNYFYFPTTFISQTLSLSKYFHFPNTITYQQLSLSLTTKPTYKSDISSTEHAIMI